MASDFLSGPFTFGEGSNAIKFVDRATKTCVFPKILSTTHIKPEDDGDIGVDVVSAKGFIEMKVGGVPLDDEYSEAAMRDLINKTASNVKDATQLHTVGIVTAVGSYSVDGGELNSAVVGGSTGGMVQIGPTIGVLLQGGVTVAFEQIMPFTDWDGINEGQMLNVIKNLLTSGGIVTLVIGIVTGLSTLSIFREGRKKMQKRAMDLWNETTLKGLTGKTLPVKYRNNNDVNIDELGYTQSSLRSWSLSQKCEYLLAGNKLYQDIQPFTLMTYKGTSEQYSTPDCAFKFTFSGDETEEISFITDNRSIIVGTSAGERYIPPTVNGSEQYAQSGSFFGSERIQGGRSQSSVYFLMKGGQRILQLSWEPNVPAPLTVDLQRYNREILRNREVISLKSSRTVPSKIFATLSDGTVAVATAAAGNTAWSRVTTDAGKIVDTASLPFNGMSAIRFVGIQNEKGTFACGIVEKEGEADDIYLDQWQEYTSVNLKTQYNDNAVVYDKTNDKEYSLSDAPGPGAGLYIGYHYTSLLRTLPSVDKELMAPTRVARARLRFIDSHLPMIKGYPSGSVNKIVQFNNTGNLVSGVVDIPVPGNVELDAAVEVFTNEPKPLSILAMLTEEGL